MANERFVITSIDSCYECPDRVRKHTGGSILYCENKCFAKNKRIGDFYKILDGKIKIPIWCPLPEEVWLPKRKI